MSTTFKIGNKVKGIIRSYAPCVIGGIELKYDNQPYTFIKDIEASLTFAEKEKDAKRSDMILLGYDHDTLKEVRLNNVLLTDRIFKLVYNENEDKLFSKQEYYTSDTNKQIYLNTPDEIYQVFIYDDEGNLEQAFGTYNNTVLTVEKADTEYSIYYSYLGEKSYRLDKPANFYMTLDLEVTGNEDDETQDMSIHIEKCVLKVNKNMYFNKSNSNAVDLIGTVIYTGKDYITLK